MDNNIGFLNPLIAELKLQKIGTAQPKGATPSAVIASPKSGPIDQPSIPTAQPKINDDGISENDMLYGHLSQDNIEGVKEKAYWDKNGKKWTIGVGQTGKDIKEGTVWSKEQIRSDFDRRANANRDILKNRYGPVWERMNKKQRMVVESLAWNTGVDKIESWPTMHKALSEKNPNKIPEAIDVFGNEIWTIRRSGGEILKGLENRRAIETDIYFGRGPSAPLKLQKIGGKEGETLD